jgi:prepilin-type N-terminal cleavage/methylation domain-containing protein/prepilin-type processing-associated H-X9-DG protein
MGAEREKQSAFTLIELLVVIAIIAILAAILLPVLDAAEKRALATKCLNNEKQLALAWYTYANDNQDNMVPNRGLNGQPGSLIENPLTDANLMTGGSLAQWCPGNVQNSVCAINYKEWIEAGLLFPYNANIAIYLCPADNTTFPRGSTTVRVPSLRTYSMNCWIQPMDHSGYTAGQQWLYPQNAGYRVFSKLSNMFQPGPSSTWVFMEEAPPTIDDGFFAISASAQYTNTWIELPAVLHGRSSEIAFADGHAETRNWTDGNMIQGGLAAQYQNEWNIPASPLSGDWAWLWSKSTAPAP